MTERARPRSPLWMVVLSLAAETPMHPYRMQTLIRQRGKDEIANVAQRNSVYQTIEALRRGGLVVARGTAREERRPERTVYEATELGRRTLGAWLRTALSTPAREFPEFPAALSLLEPSLAPEELAALFETRIEALTPRLAALTEIVPGLPRVFVLEAEYQAAIFRAEVAFLRGVVHDLRSGALRYPNPAVVAKISSAIEKPKRAVSRAKAKLV